MMTIRYPMFAVAFCLASPALSQDTLARFHGTVTGVLQPLSSGTFGDLADTQVGDAVVLDIRVTPTVLQTHSSGSIVYRIEGDGSKISVGDETSSLATALGTGFQIRDSAANGDSMFCVNTLSISGAVLVELNYIDATALTLGSHDPSLLQGQTISLPIGSNVSGLTSFNGAGVLSVVYDSVEFSAFETVGDNYCQAAANSTGELGALQAFGSAAVSDNDLLLWGSSLPRNAVAFFLGSRTQGAVTGPGGSAGNLCLGGSIGRYVSGGAVADTGSTGTAALPLDLAALAMPTGSVSAQAGDTWNFQLWHRDEVSGQATSNFTEALSITFQ